MKIAASFLSIKENIKENINLLTETDIDFLHLDIMDGLFVSNKTWDIEEIKQIISYKKPLDVHLMVNDVEGYIAKFKTINPEFITFHYEVSCDIMKIINILKTLNIKVGLSIKPDTKVDEIEKYLSYLDLVLVMSVEPGKGGQKFIPTAVEKIEKLDNLRKENNYRYLISVDGGINIDTISEVKKSDIIVIGSYLTNGNYKENLKKVKEKIYG